MNVIVALAVCIVGVLPAATSGTFVQEALTKVFGPWTSYGNSRTVQLLNQLCNESQNNNTTAKDACYGCFFRASNQPAGFPMLLTMATCADAYLNNTDYGHCRMYLRIRQCVREAASMFATTFDCNDLQLAQLFVNATACVLAKTRCSVTNPVTGAVQDDAFASKLHVASTTALQVNSDYDVTIIQVPFANSAKNDECGKYRNLDQASWPTSEC